MKKSRNLIYLLLGLAACTYVVSENAQKLVSLAQVTPESLGMASDSLVLLDNLFQEFADSSLIAGGVMLVAKDNQLIYENTMGSSDRARIKPLQDDAIFRIASMTKPITTVAVMQLYEQGKLRFNDPITKYIPEFDNPQVIENWNETDSTYELRPTNEVITLHHLLTHTSGLGYAFIDPALRVAWSEYGAVEGWTKDSILLADNAQKFAQLPLRHEVGEKFTYGIGMDIMGHVVEIVSGMPLDDYFEKHIFEPLGMKDTYFYLPDEKADQMVEMWYTDDFDIETFPESIRPDYPVDGAKLYFQGGGGLVSSAWDYLNFASCLLNKGEWNGARILESPTVEIMMTNQIGDLFIDDGKVQFGYGAAIQTGADEIGRLPGRYSWGGFWQTHFWIDPQRKIIGVLMTNSIWSPKANELYNRAEQIVNSAVIDEVAS